MTASFNRTLNENLLAPWVLDAYPLLGQLLALWTPSGIDSNDGKGLRLAIRDGYVNFYAQGQSVFKVTFKKTSAQLDFEIHDRYKNPGSKSERYVKVPGEREQADLFRWRETARSYPGKKAEKVFVDTLLGANADAIDVEATLPGVSSGEPKKNGGDVLVAPRMDLVVLEPWASGYRLAFWEAKLSTNGEARARGEAAMPKVVGQLEKYAEWLRDDAHAKHVIKAYSETCRMLVALHQLAKIDAPLSPAIVTVGTGAAQIVELDPQVRLAIDDSGVHGVRASESFTKNGHAKKLRDAGIPLRLIGADSSFGLKV